MKKVNKIRVTGIKAVQNYITEMHDLNFEYGYPSVNIRAIIEPANAYNKRCKITSSNEDVIESGYCGENIINADDPIKKMYPDSYMSSSFLTIKGYGIAKLTIESEDGNFKDTVIVNVVNKENNFKYFYDYQLKQIKIDSGITLEEFYKNFDSSFYGFQKIYDLNGNEVSDENIVLKSGMKMKVKKSATDTISEFAFISDEKINYNVHVQNDGWQSDRADGEVAGTEGRSLRLEGIRIYLPENLKKLGNIQYKTHVQNIGWQNFVSNGELSGTTGQSLRLEAIQIRLTGELEKYYDVYYRVHAQNFGWIGWTKNGSSAGTAGYSYRLEAIQIKLIAKGDNTYEFQNGENPFYSTQKLEYTTHVQNYGWLMPTSGVSGTTGQSLRLEAIKIDLKNQLYNGGIEYSTHVQNIGWQGYVKNGETSGTSGQSLRLEAIKIRLTGEMSKKYDIYYKVHAQGFGWMDWAKNGEPAGTAGYSYRLEAIEIVLVEKNGVPPGETTDCFRQI